MDTLRKLDPDEVENYIDDLRTMIAEEEKRLAWLESPENNEENNVDFEFTETDIISTMQEIHDLTKELDKAEKRLKKLLKNHPKKD